MILVDAGNTRVKFAVAGEHGPERIEAVAYDDAAFVERSSTERALVSCVAKEEVWLQLKQRFPLAERVTTPRESHGLACGYDDHARWGTDRFLACLGLWLDGTAPFVVASVGTALAIDVVDAQGVHRGGLIAPSPRAMRDAVLGSTARVRLVGEGRVGTLGRNTEDGLESGVWLAAAALVDRAYADAAIGEDGTLALTGGDALALSPLVRTPHEIVPDAALRGLWHLAR